MKKILTLISIVTISISGAFAQALPNAGFEIWTHNSFPSYDNPDNWNTLNSSTGTLGVYTCLKATAAADIHSGTAAIKLITKSVFGQTANGITTIGTINTTSQTIGGGIAFTGRPDSIAGWYKYNPVTGDNGFVELQLLGAGGDADTVGYVRFQTPNTAVGTYTHFVKAINYPSVNPVTHALWILSASKDAVTHFVGSTLFIDDLQLITNSSANVTEQNKLEISVGPNPITDYLLVKNPKGTKAIIAVFDITGRKILQQSIGNSSNAVMVNAFPMGLYLYTITDESKRIIKTGKVIFQK